MRPKVLGDIADCGQELCCRTFLTRLQPVSMRMAKVQKTTLDPAKISGRCGRLKCCLRYEFDGYMALRAGLPRPGNRVRHQERSGVVVGVDVLSQLVTVQLDEGERLVVHAGQIQRETPAPPANGARADRPDRPSWIDRGADRGKTDGICAAPAGRDARGPRKTERSQRAVRANRAGGEPARH